MKIAIITAIPEETGALLKRFAPVRKSIGGGLSSYLAECGGHEIIICESGMGMENASRTARIAAREILPDIMVSCGLCGGLAPDLQVADIVLARAVAVFEDVLQEEVQVEIPVSCADFVACQAKEGRRVFGGLFASTAVITAKARLAAMLSGDSECPVVEMESAAVAMIAAEYGIPFVGIRSVSDPADEELGFSLDEFCDQRMRIRISLVLLTIVRKPRIIPQLLRLARNSRIAAAALARSVGQFLEFI